MSSFRVEVDGDDEEWKMFRTARTEEEDGVGILLLLCPVREFEEEDEVEAVPCVLLVRS